MTIMYVCAVFDTAVQAFLQPFQVPHTGAAVRGFTDEINHSDKDQPMARHPDDYELYLLATFDTETGQYDQDNRRQLVRGKDAKREN